MDGSQTVERDESLSGDVIAAVLTQVLIAAGTYLAAKRALAETTPLSIVSLRVVAAGSVYAVLFALLSTRRFPRGAQLKTAALLGLIAGPVNQGLFFYGLSTSTAAHGALLYALTPVGVYLWDVAAGIDKLRRRELGGIALAFVGVTVLLLGRGLAGALGPMKGDSFILLGVVAWVAYTRITRTFSREVGALRSSGWAMMFGGVWMLPLVPFLYRPGELAAASHVTHAAFVFLVLFSSVIAYLLWGYALERAPAAKVAVFSNLQPVATAVCGWALLSEPIGWEVLAGGVLVMAGVRLAQR